MKTINVDDLQKIAIEEYTTPSPFSIAVNDSAKSAFKLMRSKEVRHLPVINDQDDVVGIISDRDLASVKTFSFADDIKVSDLMTETPLSVHRESGLLEAAYMLVENKVGSLIVNDGDGKIYGIFTNTDALNALIEVLRGDIEK